MSTIRQYRTSLINEMPSRVWKRILKEQANEVAKKTKLGKIDKLLDMKYKEVLVTVANLIEECKTEYDVDQVQKLYDLVSVLYALEEAFEFVVDVQKLSTWESNDTLDFMKNFKMPFEGMLINFKLGDKYYSDFINIIHMEEKYIKENKEHDIYLVKECAAIKNDKGQWSYGILTEATFIPLLAPRVIVHCNIGARQCPHFVPTSISKNISLLGAKCLAAKQEEWCLRAPRTIGMCEHWMEELRHKDTYKCLITAQTMLDYIRKRPVIRGYINNSNVTKNNQSSEKTTGADGTRKERFVDLTKPIKRYNSETRRSNNGHSHASPKQHIRQGHLRRLRNGNIVHVREAIVNGNKKEKIVYKV